VTTAAARGAAIGAGVAAGGAAVRRHPKATLLAAALGALIAVTPARKRGQLIKRMAVIAALLVGLAVLGIGVVLVVGVNANSGPVSPAPTSAPTPASTYCQWDPQICGN
jgi:peptidoglycan/LPS O-acetylase OafA/YrhL